MDILNGDIRRLIHEILHVRNKNATGSVENAELNTDRLKKLKNYLRQDEELLQPFFEDLMENYLWKDNVIVRLYTVLLIDEIFRRSHRFRECVLDNFEEFLKYTAETDALRAPLPPPKNLAKILKQRTLKIVHNWFNSYGPAYRKLQVAYEYLKGCKTFDFQRIEAETIVERERSELEQRRREQTKAKVIKKVTEDLQEIEEDLSKCLTEIDAGFRLLIPDMADDIDKGNTNSPLAQESSSDSTHLNVHGIPSVKFDLPIAVSFQNPSVKVDQDNVDLINNLKDCNKLIIGQYLPKIRQLLNIVSRYGGDETLTKTLIDWRVRLEESKRKFDDLHLDGMASRSTAAAAMVDEDDADFEVVPEKEGLEEYIRPASPQVPDHIRDWSKNESVKPKYSVSTSAKDDQPGPLEKGECGPSASPAEKSATPSDDDEPGPSTSGLGKPSIPIIPYGIDLAYWEQEKIPRPMIVRNNADSHRFWRGADGDEAVECSDVEAAAYRTRVMEFVGEFEPVERECRAPVGGKLCTRRDRYKCPFHGVIIARDEEGKPMADPALVKTKETESIEKVRSNDPSVFGDPEMIREIERTTGVQLSGQKRNSRNRHGEEDTSTSADSTRDRLARKIFNRSSVKRVAAVQSAMDDAKHKKRFGGQWQYVYRDQ